MHFFMILKIPDACNGKESKEYYHRKKFRNNKDKVKIKLHQDKLDVSLTFDIPDTES